jgi:hypothetical protein
LGGVVDGIPLINRSDGATFHLILFSGPYTRPNVSGGFHPNQMMCTFAYVNNRTEPEKDFLVVAILHPKRDLAEIQQQIEDATDKIADLLELRNKLGPAYTFDGINLSSGLID